MGWEETGGLPALELFTLDFVFLTPSYEDDARRLTMWFVLPAKMRCQPRNRLRDFGKTTIEVALMELDKYLEGCSAAYIPRLTCDFQNIILFKLMTMLVDVHIPETSSRVRC